MAVFWLRCCTLTRNGLRTTLTTARGCSRSPAAGWSRLDAADRARFHHADARSWQPPDGAAYDLIATHFFLDCFTAPNSHRCSPALRRRRYQTPAGSSRSSSTDPRLGRLAGAAVDRRAVPPFGLATGLKVRRLPDYAPLLRRRLPARAGPSCVRACVCACVRVRVRVQPACTPAAHLTLAAAVSAIGHQQARLGGACLTARNVLHVPDSETQPRR